MFQQWPQTKVEASSKATSCQVGGETVILDVASGQYFALDPIGSVIWNHLQTPCSVATLCERLMAEYDVPAARCEAEVSALLEQLAHHGLVRLDA